MKLGVLAPLMPGLADSGDFIRSYTALLEDCGVESIWGVEHVVIAEDHEPRYPYSESGDMGTAFRQLALPDALEFLSFVAGCSTQLNLGTAVMLAPLHSPAVLAKRVATLDALSGGRMMLGLGIGWQQEEYAAVGAPFRSGARLEECMLAMRLVGRFAGHLPRRALGVRPRVLQPEAARGAVPILLGGNSAPVIDRAGRIGDGWLPSRSVPTRSHVSATGSARSPRTDAIPTRSRSRPGREPRPTVRTGRDYVRASWPQVRVACCSGRR